MSKGKRRRVIKRCPLCKTRHYIQIRFEAADDGFIPMSEIPCLSCNKHVFRVMGKLIEAVCHVGGIPIENEI